MPIIALLASIALHASLMFMLANGKGGGEGDADKQGKKSSSVKVRLLDKPAETESKKKKEIVPENKGKVVIKKKKKKKKKPVPPQQKVVEHKCDEYYEGIGIQFGMAGGGCRVSYIAKGYPADRAGLLVGDLVISDAASEAGCPGRGPTGTMITLKVLRGSQALTLTMVREKICTSPEKE